MQLTETVFLVAGAPYGTLGNTYAIRQGKDLVLIDTGSERAITVIEENLRQWKLDQMQIRAVFLTHHHYDHAGAAFYFQARGAKIICGEEDAGFIRKGGFSMPEYPYENFAAHESYGYRPCMPDVTVRGDQWLQEGKIRIRAYDVPGHTAGSRAYWYEDTKQSYLFTGDFIYCEGFRGEFVRIGWKGSADYSEEKYVQSAYKVFKLKPDAVLGGHGVPYLQGGAVAMRKSFEAILLGVR